MEKIWLDSYPPGVPHTVESGEYASLLELFEQSIEQYADKTAFLNMGQKLTYRQLDQQSRAFAAYLQHGLHLPAGSRVAVMMPNLLQYPVALFGILRAGMVVVNVNPLYTARELKHQLCDAGTEAIVIVSNFAHTLASVVDDTPVKHVILSDMGDLLSQPKRSLVNFVVKRVKKLVPAFSLPGAIGFRQALSRGAALAYRRPQLTGDDLAFLQYTGGTTGVAKGAMLTHGNMLANISQVVGVIKPVLVQGEEVIVTPLPLYHIFSLTANLMTFMRYGAANLLITNPRDMAGFVKELKKYPFTAISGVNTLFNGLLNTPGFDQLDFSKMKISLGGGMAVQSNVAERWKAITGVALLEGYGLTECSPVVTVVPIDQQEYTGSIGLPVPSTDIRIIDEQGNQAGLDQPGELQVKGPQVMKGYWQRPDATAEVLSDDGWFATGDIATVDHQGFVRIVDRKKDMILISGFNVFPNEIEDVVTQHPDVVEAAVIGVPHKVTGEAAKLFVVTQSKQLTEKELKAFCRQHLTAYKVPKLIEFRDELPKSNVGKILRRELRDAEVDVKREEKP